MDEVGKSVHIMFSAPLEPYPNHFVGFEGVLKTTALEKLSRAFNETDHPLNSSAPAKAIQYVLDATYDFRSATDAKITVEAEELLKKLNVMGEALKIASAAYDKCPEDSVRPVLAVAIKRCRESIQDRLEELAGEDEELYKLFLDELKNAVARPVLQKN